MSQNLLLLDLSNVTNRILSMVQRSAFNHNIDPMEVESLFDWLVIEALANNLVLSVHGRLQNHHRHDVYKCIFDEIGAHVSSAVMELIYGNGLTFFENNENVKVLVTYRDLIIVRSRYDGLI